jgi:hypothetical protein
MRILRLSTSDADFDSRLAALLAFEATQDAAVDRGRHFGAGESAG